MREAYSFQSGEPHEERGYPFLTIFLGKKFYRKVERVSSLRTLDGIALTDDGPCDALLLPNGVPVAAFKDGHVCYTVKGDVTDDAYGLLLSVPGVEEEDFITPGKRLKIFALITFYSQVNHFVKNPWS